jgi:hypothetical protein
MIFYFDTKVVLQKNKSNNKNTHLNLYILNQNVAMKKSNIHEVFISST